MTGPSGGRWGEETARGDVNCDSDITCGKEKNARHEKHNMTSDHDRNCDCDAKVTEKQETKVNVTKSGGRQTIGVGLILLAEKEPLGVCAGIVQRR